jgi:cytochrome c peroxidase
VEEQAGGPLLNPVEMAMPSKEAVVAKIAPYS